MAGNPDDEGGSIELSDDESSVITEASIAVPASTSGAMFVRPPVGPPPAPLDDLGDESDPPDADADEPPPTPPPRHGSGRAGDSGNANRHDATHELGPVGKEVGQQRTMGTVIASPFDNQKRRKNMSLASLCGVEITAISGQPFIVAFEVRDATDNLIGGAEVSVTADGAPAVRFENGRPFNMKKTGRIGSGKGVAEFAVTAPAQEFEIIAKCGADTANVAVKVASSSIVQTAGGAAIQGADGRVYAIPAHHSHAAIVGMPAPVAPVVNAIPAGGGDIIIIDY